VSQARDLLERGEEPVQRRKNASVLPQEELHIRELADGHGRVRAATKERRLLVCWLEGPDRKREILISVEARLEPATNLESGTFVEASGGSWPGVMSSA